MVGHKENKATHGLLEVGCMLISFGVKCIITRRYLFLYVSGEAQQAISVGLLAVCFGTWWSYCFLRQNKTFVEENLRQFAQFFLLLTLLVAAYILPAFFTALAFKLLYVAIPVSVLLLSYQFVNRVIAWYKDGEKR